MLLTHRVHTINQFYFHARLNGDAQAQGTTWDHAYQSQSSRPTVKQSTTSNTWLTRPTRPTLRASPFSWANRRPPRPKSQKGERTSDHFPPRRFPVKGEIKRWTTRLQRVNSGRVRAPRFTKWIIICPFHQRFYPIPSPCTLPSQMYQLTRRTNFQGCQWTRKGYQRTREAKGSAYQRRHLVKYTKK